MGLCLLVADGRELMAISRARAALFLDGLVFDFIDRHHVLVVFIVFVDLLSC